MLSRQYSDLQEICHEMDLLPHSSINGSFIAAR
jgi:hypothetical protein